MTERDKRLIRAGWNACVKNCYPDVGMGPPWNDVESYIKWVEEREKCKSFSGKKHTKETKRKMSESAKGKIPWCRGKIWIQNVEFGQTKYILESKFSDYEKDGWERGRLPFKKKV